MSFTSIRERLHVDPRTLDDEIADEFAHHLALIERDLVAEGRTPEEAASLARVRFGDVHRIHRACRAIALKEQVMAKRIHLAITISLAIFLTAALVFAVASIRRARAAEAMAVQQAMLAEQAAQQARSAADAARQAAP